MGVRRTATVLSILKAEMLAIALSLLAISPSSVPGCSCTAFLPEYDPSTQTPTNWYRSGESRPSQEQEGHLSNLQQLTFGGQNAESYWNLDASKIVFQARIPGYPDEQIFTMNPDGSDKKLVSTGLGRCTCSYFTPDGKYIYFSSTHEYNRGAQAPPDMSKGYVWVVNPWFALYRVPVSGGKPEQVLRRFGYIAETTIAPDGSYMTFTGGFNGELDIYRSNLDGTNIRKLTDEPGYDGGPFVSWDSKTIVYRRDTIDSETELNDFRTLLKQNMVRPGKLEIWIMNADGSGKRQVTNLGAASFAPFLHPDNKTIIFCTNYDDPRGREFDLYTINVDGTGLKRITHTPEFDGFPMFSRDGKKLLFSSNRFGTVQGETNVFVADWKN